MRRKPTLILAFALALLLAPLASAQFGINTDVAVGAGFVFQGEEDAAFDAKSLYGGLHWNGLSLPGPSVSTGIGIEFHPASVSVDGSLVNVDYRLWSLNRFDCPSALYCGTDLKIGQGGDGGWVADFDQRVVVGMRIARAGSAVINFEVYTLEDDRPISAFILVRWGGENQPPD